MKLLWVSKWVVAIHVCIARLKNAANITGMGRENKVDVSVKYVEFQEARRIVDEAERATWTLGTYWVAPWGFENPTHFRVISGAAEWLDSGDVRFRPRQERFALVDKQTGELSYHPLPQHGHPLEVFLSSMTPVGSIESENDDAMSVQYALSCNRLR